MSSFGKRAVSRSIGEAKAHFAECIRQAEAGQETILTRHGRPVARLTPIAEVAGIEAEVRERGPSYGAASSEPVGDPSGEPTGKPIGKSAGAEAAAVRRELLHRLLEEEIRPLVPASLRGQTLSKEETERILGYGRRGA